ncbi:GNAT family N-acetyltransferase [Candidatus Woesearchaeota archaeon]|nr:GNAT family N-acetyltransferase [Candidatus Woesearchaeota archaeon]
MIKMKNKMPELEYIRTSSIKEDHLYGDVHAYEGEKKVAGCGFKIDLEGIAELGYYRVEMLWVSDEKQGTGLSLKVARAALQYLQECAKEYSWPLKSVVASVLKEDSAVKRILKKLGINEVIEETKDGLIYQLDFEDEEKK